MCLSAGRGRQRLGDKSFQRAAQNGGPTVAFAGFTQRREEGGERCAVALRYPCLERVSQCRCILEAVERVEHAEAFAGIGRYGEHSHFHTRFQLLVGFGHMLGQGLFAGGEEQQPPLLHLSACLASVIGACFAGAITEHLDRLADDAWIAHADFVQYQEAVGMRGSNGFQRVVGGTP
ncbi:hypothetical protein D3C85_1381880 [compost metagenome]